MVVLYMAIYGTVKPLNPANRGTGEKAAVLGGRRYWEGRY